MNQCTSHPSTSQDIAVSTNVPRYGHSPSFYACPDGPGTVTPGAGAAWLCSGFIAGKRSTSLMSIDRPKHFSSATDLVEIHINSWHILVEFVRNMTNQSIPIPQPPVGGNPCSSLLVGKWLLGVKIYKKSKSRTRPRMSRRHPGFHRHQRPSASPEGENSVWRYSN